MAPEKSYNLIYKILFICKAEILSDFVIFPVWLGNDTVIYSLSNELEELFFNIAILALPHADEIFNSKLI